MTQRAILVLGMHRSGTSALTGLLVRLGAQAPRTPMAANEHNPLGFWESSALYEFHERLLLAGGSNWDQWTAFDPSRVDEAGLGSGDELRALLRQEFGEAPLFVVKDPRICRFTPWWLRQLEADGIDPAAILMVRNPLEVAHSLAARDGIGLEHALLLWLRHVLDAEFDTRAVRRSVIWYSDLLLDWESAAHRIATDLGLVWSVMPETFQTEVASFLRPELRHHVVDIGNLDVSPPLCKWVRQTYAALALLAGTSDRQTGALDALDRVRGTFDQASAIFDKASSGDRRAHSDRMNRLKADRDELQRLASLAAAERDRLTHQASTAEVELERERQETSRLAAEREALAVQMQAERDRLEAERNQLVHHASTVEVELEHQRHEASRLAAEREALARQMAAERNRLEAERDRLMDRASTVEVELEHQRHEASRVADEREALAVQMEAERDGFSRHVAALEADLEHLRHETWHLTAERDAITQERERLRLELVQTRHDLGSEIASLTGRLATSDDRIQQIQQSRSWRWTAFLRAMMRPWVSARSRPSR